MDNTSLLDWGQSDLFLVGDLMHTNTQESIAHRAVFMNIKQRNSIRENLVLQICDYNAYTDSAAGIPMFV